MSESDDKRVGGGRGPAFPFIGLEKAIERAEQIRDQNMLKIAAAPIDYYKAWQYSGDNGKARQTLAALKQYGLVDYVGRGDARQVRLSELARRIILDNVPDSHERATAIRNSALNPTVHEKLWERFGPNLPPDFALQTFLLRDLDFNIGSVKDVISVYQETFEYARLSEPDNLPSSSPALAADQPATSPDTPPPPFGPIGASPMLATVIHDSAPPPMMGSGASDNDIKIMLDGDRIRVSAVVDIKGAKRLMKALTANIALLEDDEDDD